MKITQILYALLLMLLSACGSSTDIDGNISKNSSDFMFAGNPGTELVFETTYTEADSNGIQVEISRDTITWTIIERNIPHPKGGISVHILEEDKTKDIPYGLYNNYYFSYNNNAIVVFTSLKDTTAAQVLKYPLTVGSQWSNQTIKSITETVHTIIGTVQAVRVESKNRIQYFTDSTIVTVNNYFSHEVLIPLKITSYEIHDLRSNKVRIQTATSKLIQYTKK